MEKEENLTQKPGFVQKGYKCFIDDLSRNNPLNSQEKCTPNASDR